MNYYEHHIGDYAAATSHLSPLEDGIYSRLLRMYYRDEKPLPLDLKTVQRAVGARTRDEKEAVDQMLQEFFQADDDGWHNKRCDEEIAKVQEKREKARRSAEARWNPGKHACERIGSDMRTHSVGDANASETHNGRNAHQTPDTRHQTPDLKATAGTPTITGQALEGGTHAGHLAAELNRAGLRCTSHDPRLIAAATAGITAAEVIELRAIYPDKPAAYLIAAATNQRAENANGVNHAARKPGRKLSAVERVHANIERARKERGERSDDDGTVIEGTAVRVAN